jgi:hypothetical protein
VISFIYQKDKNGNDVIDKDGNITLKEVNITITGKVIDFSDNNVDMNFAIAEITSSLEDLFSGTFEGVKFNTKAHFTVANTMDDVTEDDHLIVLAEQFKPQKGENGKWGIPDGAVGFLGGKVSFVGADLFTGLYDRFFGSNGKRTSSHEFGHLFGLEHTSKGLMKSGGEETNLTASEFGTIIENYRKGKLNYGTNSTIFGLPNTGRMGNDNILFTNTYYRKKKKK